MHLLLLSAALLGHAFLWIAMVNRTHAAAMPRWATWTFTALAFAMMVFPPLAFAWWVVQTDAASFSRFHWELLPKTVLLYLGICWVSALLTVGWWLRRHALHRPPAVVRRHRRRSIDMAATPSECDRPAHHFLVHLPRNEILQLDRTERAIEVPRLCPPLDGLSIIHLSDFHFTGRVAKRYFQEVVRHANETEPDLVAVTGDLVDFAAYIDWIPDTLGRLRAGHGVYFVLGNHDTRVDVRRLRRTLVDSGLIDLGGRWTQIEIRGEPIILAGNELPWLAPAADMSECPPRDTSGRPLRIVLSHSPDQLSWAQAHDVDLLLAGHTHGGQIRLPLIGPILSPSREGVKYASGVFHAPPTVMHVTRGVSGELPIRLNCPPEIAHLVLHSAASA
ncbi:MAG TPA: metallophosphoesterase [Thermoguttaceae bacterium]|nr:metallophosphoesterase [Thermoguttaceae bacterium]